MGRATPGLALILSLALAAPGFAQQPQPGTAGAVVARRGAVTLTEPQLRDLIARETPDVRDALLRDPQALAQFVRNRMIRLALIEEARAQRFDQRPDVVARAEQARLDAIAEAFLESLSQPGPGFPPEADVQAAYDANRTRFLVPRQFQVSQLFLAVPPAAPREAEEAALRRIRDLRAQALLPANNRNRVDFAELARRHSQDQASAARGGALDWLREDRLIEPIRVALAGLEEGAISEPVRSDQGWHLIRLHGTRPAGPAPLPEVRETLVGALRQQRTQDLSRLTLADLLRREPVLIDEIQLGRIAGLLRAAPPGR